MSPEWGKGPAFEDVKEWLCEVCGKTLTASAIDAHRVGWDTPPYFTGYTKCGDCGIDQTALWLMWQNYKKE